MPTQLEYFAYAERLQESGDNYSAHNASSGASGAYQFIFSTWQSALALAGMRGTVWYYKPASAAPPIIQDAAAYALLSRYYNAFGHSWFNVAEAWYGGPGAVGHPNRGGGPGYPTVGQYAASVYARFLFLGGTGQPIGTVGSNPAPHGPTGSTEWSQANGMWSATGSIYAHFLPSKTNDILAFATI